VVETGWPSKCERTSTSVIVACSPTNSTRSPARLPLVVSTTRRSTIESGSSRSVGSVTFFTSSENRNATGSRMPESNGVRHEDVALIQTGVLQVLLVVRVLRDYFGSRYLSPLDTPSDGRQSIVV